MTALPFTTGCFAGHRCHHLPKAAITHLNLPPSEFASATRPSEAAVDQSGAKAPLRNEDPDGRHSSPSQYCAESTSRVGGTRVCKDEERKGDSNPGPASLDKDNVED